MSGSFRQPVAEIISIRVRGGAVALKSGVFVVSLCRGRVRGPKLTAGFNDPDIWNLLGRKRSAFASVSWLTELLACEICMLGREVVVVERGWQRGPGGPAGAAQVFFPFFFFCLIRRVKSGGGEEDDDLLASPPPSP